MNVTLLIPCLKMPRSERSKKETVSICRLTSPNHFFINIIIIIYARPRPCSGTQTIDD